MRANPPRPGDVDQLLSQLLTGTIEPTHDRPDWRSHDLGDLLVGESLDIGQQNNLPELVGQPVESVKDLLVGQPVQGFQFGGPKPIAVMGGRPRDLPVLDVLVI